MKRWQCISCYTRYRKNVTGELVEVCNAEGHLPGFGDRSLPIRRYNIKCPVCGHKWHFRRLRKNQ